MFGRCNFAQLCYERRFYAPSAAIWSAGFAADPKLAEDMQAQHRYNAACSAALAVAGKGIEKPPLDEQAKGRWREQALEWLKADLVYWTKQTESGAAEAKTLAHKTLQHWRGDSDLASVRDAQELSKLADAERKEWQTFWSKVAAPSSKPEHRKIEGTSDLEFFSTKQTTEARDAGPRFLP